MGGPTHVGDGQHAYVIDGQVTAEDLADLDRPACQHDGTPLDPMPDDPALPDYIEPLECPDCGEVYLYDREADTLEVDG